VGDIYDVKNYRPISISSALFKVLEKLMYDNDKLILPFLYEYIHIKKEVSLPHPVLFFSGK
jgi:hypothetical protein